MSKRTSPVAAFAATLTVLALSGCHDGETAAPLAAICPSTPGEVLIPAGDFWMGDDVYPEEGPEVRVRVAPFFMDVHEVTNAQFARFVEATGYVTRAERGLSAEEHPEVPAEARRPGAAVFRSPEDPSAAWWIFVPGANWRHPAGPGSTIEGRDSYPVVHIALEDAQAYADWVGRRLPTEAEWEWAARAGNPDANPSLDPPADANTWQGTFPFADSGDDGHAGLAPVGCYASSRYGLHDIIGNVWEWTSEPFSSRGEGASPGDPRQPGVEVGVIKGGSYLCARNYCMRYRPGARQAQDLTLASSHVGFRTVRDASPT